MEKIFRTKSYGDIRLQLDTGKGKFITKGIELKVKINMDTGDASLFIEPEDLEKLKKIDSENI